MNNEKTSTDYLEKETKTPNPQRSIKGNQEWWTVLATQVYV